MNIFSLWHTFKQTLAQQSKEQSVFFHEREIWFAHMGKNIGFEQNSAAILSQLRLLDKSRLSHFSRKISDTQLRAIKKSHPNDSG